MRTTLDIDDDLLAAALELARHEGSTVGEMISRLVRRSLIREAAGPAHGSRSRRATVPGFRPFPARRGVVATDEQVEALRDAEGV